MEVDDEEMPPLFSSDDWNIFSEMSALTIHGFGRYAATSVCRFYYYLIYLLIVL